MPEKSAQHRIVDRLRRVEGQVRGISQMVEDDRYCIDILHQLQAVKSALARAEDEILKNHASHCVAEAIASGDADEQRQKFGELIDLFAKAKR
ncbi:MAG: metal-sensitive transcriptional regulator [Pseudomonadota bacterium]|jgi:DNA-binding FrmR family transcriptional regulator|uniref:Metal-sensitive transcriptional regulator n=1 Tax=Qipengyuania pacifica TaxID=2860199 RepID=A0ABS7JIN7_9SPHN|nr:MULTISPECIES: metal-sensitive transcriptional regulator [Erythrobacteraceae]MAG42090.1 transcriptional regulator [Erythrobacteraceae bacterium]MCH2496369.1 metal-sensitive transcriptional regulator [Erythrobacter sp.]MEC7888433.1 metal-sensitive transcriptional regulator [Pseudomonadota bacterium]MAP70072.1 transcriptional regulator [Erythrobacteraceae bacterium]MBX7488690.1 metal-sensitive transcriptional regulator [Qipengyuania aerophila]|tara:strand:- start:813 stop:1091 length:279 start_codon:yes stop_codon:yes gene_type:complete